LLLVELGDLFASPQAGQFRMDWRLPFTGIVKGGAVKLKHTPILLAMASTVYDGELRGCQVGSAYIG
jgi:hypothetical protein